MKKGAYALCVFLCVFLFAVANSTHGALLTREVDFYRLDSYRKGMAVAAQNLGSLAALISSLWVIGALSKPRLLWLATAATAALLLPIGLAPAFPVFVALFGLLGVSVGYIDTLASSAMADLYQGKAAARMMCVLHAVFGTAGIACPLLFQWMLRSGAVGGWNQIFLWIAGLGGLILLYAVPVARRREKETNAQGAAMQRFTMNGFARFFHAGRPLMLLAVSFNSLYLAGIAVWVNRYVGETLGSPDLGSLALSMLWVGTTASRLLTPLLPFSPVKIIGWSSLASAALLAIGVLSGSAVAMCAATLLAGLLAGANIPLILHVVSDQFRENTAMATTITFIALYVAQSISSPLMGAIESVWGLAAGMLLCAASLAISGGFAFLMRRRIA
ncbi:MAG: hypothetical protein GX558_05370 [Clostridiales bacterium]|nr:hypothetical protein [Clostridiales bacterium]